MILKESLRENFATYAGMTITNRAIVDVRDALKPSARMCMYAQYIDKILPSKPYQKAMKSVASGMSHFYTHGDAALYSMLARMGKPWAMRYCLEDFQGSTGTIEESDNQAAPRYTEMRLDELSLNLFKNIEKECVEKWFDNYDSTEQYPSVLPSIGFYNIVNGSSGIATAIASSIPQFNLTEVNKALETLLLNPNATFDEIYCTPDFSTGAILLNESEVKDSLKDGWGKACKLRSVVEFDAKERALIVTQIPYGVYTETIRSQLLEIVESDDNHGIDRFLDLSGMTPLIKIYLNKSANPDKVLKFLYKNTSLEYYYGINMTMLDNGKVPKVFTWKEALQAHLDHERQIYINSFEFDLRKIKARIHIIEGLLKAYDAIDEVVKLIKAASDARSASAGLQKLLNIDEVQAKAILDLKLVKLSNLDISKLFKEKEDLEKEQNRITNILTHDELLKAEIVSGLRAVAQKYGDERRTKILNIATNDEVIEKRYVMIHLTNENNILVSETSSLFAQKRGGVGNKFKLDAGEYITSTITGSTDDTAIFFTNKGNFYGLPMSEVIVGEKMSLESVLSVKSFEHVCAMTCFNEKDKKDYIIFITKEGMIKKSELNEYHTNRKMGIRALTMGVDDEIRSIVFTNEEKIGILTKSGNLLICQTKDINAIGRMAKGVKGIKLSDGDEVVSARIVPKNTTEFISISSDGLSKRSSIDEFQTTGRNTKGGKLQKLKEENSYMVDFLPLKDEKEVIIVSNRAQIKVKLNEITLLGKGAQGVKSIKTNEKDYIVGLLK